MKAKSLVQRQYMRLYVIGALLLVVGGGAWWNSVATNPERVFNGMLSQSLATSAVTLETTQSGNGTTAKQWQQFSLGAQNVSHSITTLSQTGTVVTDEMIGTPTADYTRYASIQTNQKSKSGKPLDLSKVVGVWASTAHPATQPSSLFSQAVFGTTLPIGGIVVPIGNVTSSQRASLLQQAKQDKVYQVSYKDVQRKEVAGRLQYTYNVTVSPERYVRLLKNFSADIGLHDLDKVDTTSYKGQPDLQLRMTVDVRAHHLTQVALTEGNYSQTYAAYDVPVQVTLPAHTISAPELQQRLTQLQQ